jgi:hypothetical protein
MFQEIKEYTGGIALTGKKFMQHVTKLWPLSLCLTN